jgi:acylphosphatase
VAKERIGATLVAVPEEEGARDLMKTLLEKKRDDILKEPDPATALDAFNKSMSDGNIAVLVQGIKDSLKAQKNAEFAADATKQREELMASYANNDGKLEELSQTLATNERIVATLAALPEEGGAQDFLKKLLEEKRDDILKKPNPMVALDAFNKSMSDGTIKILAQGMKDGLKAHKNPVFETQAIKQMKELMISYVDNDGKLAELSLTLPTNERIAATLASLPEGSARDLMKTLLEKKRDDILIGPDPVVALDAFNKSMSDENIVVLAQGIKDCLEVHDNPMFKEDAELQAHLDTQMKKLMDSYTKNDGKLAELSLSLSTEKNQLTAPCSYTAVLAVTSRIQEMKKINENVTNYAQNLVSIMKALPIEQRINFPHSKEPATFNAIQVFLTTNKDKPSDKVDETTPEVGQQVIDMLSNINGFLNDAQQEEQLVQKI